MSHIVTIKTQVRDVAALAAACRRLGLPVPEHGRAKLYEDHAEGWIVSLPGWSFPVVAQVETGELRYDNYGGRWGEQAKLDQLLQAYAVEKARIEARKQGHTVTEQTLPNGAIRLLVHVAGGAA